VARTAPAAAVSRTTATRQQQQGKQVSRSAVARGPLVVIITIFGLAQVGLGLAARSPTLPQVTATLLVAAMALLAFVALSGFLYAWLFLPPGVLYSPKEFDDQKMWERAVGIQDVVPSAALVLEKITMQESTIGAALDPAFLAQQARELQRGFPSSTSIMELTRCLAEAAGWDYLLVDVGEADRWLLSRLFGFITMYTTQHPLPCVVFVRSSDLGQRLLGVADPARLCGLLTRLYPWFNTTLAELLVTQNVPVFGTAPVDEWIAINLLTDFIQRLQDSVSHAGDAEWSQLSSGLWEHTRWLREEMLRGELGPALFDLGQSRLRRPGAAEVDDAMVLEILGRDTRFIAVVGHGDVFLRLYDKRRIFDRMRDRISKAPVPA
jgi:hypothetical protein